MIFEYYLKRNTGTAKKLWDWGHRYSILGKGGGGGTRRFFLLTLYNFKNIRGGVHVSPRPRPPTPRSLEQTLMRKYNVSTFF